MARQVTVYTTPSCTLCRRVLEDLELLAAEQDLVIRPVDVTADPALSARYLLLVETGDEVLDYRQAVKRYSGSRQIVLAGGDHSFTRFPEQVPQIIEFCGL